MPINTFAPIKTNVPVQNNSTVTIPQTQTTQSVEPKGLSTSAKVGIGAAAVGAITIGVLLAKGKFSQAKQLAENINFKKAETVEDAIKFGQENLGIKNYSGFETADLDVLNWINEGLVNVSNKLKGKAKLPKKILYESSDRDFLASVTPDKKNMFVNKNTFGNLDECIREKLNILKKDGFDVSASSDGLVSFTAPLYMSGSDLASLSPLIEGSNAFKEGKLTIFSDKLQLYTNLDSIFNGASATFNAPNITLKRLLSTPGVKEIVEDKGLLTNMAEIEKLSNEQKADLICDVLANCAEKGKYLGINFKPISKFQTIYHEMGHLNDANMNSHCFASYHNFSSPDKAKVLNDWVTNPKKMEAAGSVSSYAQSDEAEFLAETFAKICDNQEVSKEAMALYKELGGPALT